MNISGLTQDLNRSVPSVSLAFFRLVFGVLMLWGLIRFWSKGWIDEFYIKPSYFFTYEGFEWIQPYPGNGMFFLFAILILLCLLITVGFLYRISISLFFLGFTYIELIDKTNYLNHYYLISLLSFLMILLPMNSTYSIDSVLNKKIYRLTIPQWMVWSLQLQIGIVYFFGGLAKLKYDWLFLAQPITLWLSPHSDYFVIGPFMDEKWFAYFVSWLAAIFDITVPFFLLKNRTRNYAFGAIIFFHILTWKLFQIGMFPWMMILLVLIYYPSTLHQKIIDKALFFLKKKSNSKPPEKIRKSFFPQITSTILFFIVLFFIGQIFLPFRYLLYPGNVCWTEEGFRFSWNIMLIEKRGYTEFLISDPRTNKQWHIPNKLYLTAQQEFMMSTQPDMILQFAQYLAEEAKAKGISNPVITCNSFVSLNGRLSQRLINSEINLAAISRNEFYKKGVLQFRE